MRRRDFLSAPLAAGLYVGPGAYGAAAQVLGRAIERTALPDTVPRLAPMRVHPDQIIDIKSCLRPFRPAGPRVEIERVAEKLVVHNYGHGGSGWSLSWGAAAMAVELAAPSLEKRAAVIGCGIIGMTTAITAQRAGLDVTIYTREVLPHTRSARATGVWSPDSRVALHAAAPPDFAGVWEHMARYSWQTYREYLGLAGHPADFRDLYILSDTPPDQSPPPTAAVNRVVGDYRSTGMPQSSSEFASYGDRIRDIMPSAEVISAADNPFPAPFAKRKPLMIFNFSSIADVLLRQFHEAGGKIVIRDFHDPSELAGLDQPLIFNCPGYAARTLWNDTSLIPIRGQTAWLPPQPAAAYGLLYRGAAILSKADGVMVQDYYMSGLGDMDGVGNGMERPDRDEAERAVRVFEELFSRFGSRQVRADSRNDVR